MLSFLISLAFAGSVDLEIEQRVQSFLAKTQVQGVAISLIQGAKHQEKYFGYASAEHSKKISAESSFEIGSITKVFTPHLIVLAQQENKLSIHDPVVKYLPKLRGNPLFAQIQLIHLMTHTASVPQILTPLEKVKTRQELYQGLLKWKAPHPVGSFYAYSNIGMALLGYVLEEVYHQSYDEILREKILASRQMNSTSLKSGSHVVQGYNSSNQAVATFPDDWLLYPAGSLKSTAEDLGRYVASWNTEFLKQMQNGFCFGNHSCQGLGLEVHPQADLASDFSNVNFTIVMGASPTVRADEKLPELNDVFVDKTGSSPGMSAYVVYLPSRQVGVVVLCNRANEKARIQLGREILKILAR